jgi:POT family proton-dependent oligopeptide transporter
MSELPIPVPDESLLHLPQDRSFLGHPRGLATLFGAELWERFSYYGMRALLILFMTAPIARGGLGFPVAKAGAIYGCYTALVYLMGMPGGWLADRIISQRRAVLWGGIIIALGHFTLVIPTETAFYSGLGFIILGTGLLKPSISSMVGSLYEKGDTRRDAGFSIFYMGINIGALIAPLVCGYLGENINWHYGFVAAGIGMVLGLAQYILGGKHLGDAGRAIHGTPADVRALRIVAAASSVLGAAVLIAWWSGLLALSVQSIANGVGLLLAIIAIAFFVWLFAEKGYSAEERRHFWAILVLFIASALFWSAYEQAGSTLNLFADRNTNLHAWDVAALWGTFRASYFQSFESIFIMALAPLFAILWVKLGTRQPSSTAKFSVGLIFVALGFAVLIPVSRGQAVSPLWLTLTYLLHTIGEMCLSPVGLSTMTKLAPARTGGLIMGVWFLSMSVGDYIGGRLSSLYESLPLPSLFGLVAAFCLVVGAALIALLRPMRKLMGDIN